MLSKPSSYLDPELSDKENLHPEKSRNLNDITRPFFFRELKKIETVIDLDEAYLDHYITEKTRSQIIDWILEVIQAFNARIRTFHLCIRIMDIYCTKIKKLLPLEFYHIAVTSILLAFKYEEIKPLSMKSLSEKISHGIISIKSLIKYERNILQAFGYNIYIPTLYDYYEALMEDFCEEQRAYGKFLCDISTTSMHLCSKSSSKLAEAIYFIVTKNDAPTQGPVALCIQELNSLQEAFDKSSFPNFASKYKVFLN